MNLLTNSKLISWLWWIVMPPLVALILIFAVTIFLEKKQIVGLNANYKNSKPLRQFPKFLNSKVSHPKAIQTHIKQVEKMGHILLQACYIEKNKKFIIFKEGSKSIFLDLNQIYKNVKLVKVGIDYAIFLKNGKKIKLTLEPVKQTTQRRKASQSPSQGGRYIAVKRASFRKYTQNISQALRDIRIQEVKKNRHFTGLRLSYIRKGSFFDRMKLKVGDVIKSIDGNKLNSIMDLLPYYSRLNDIATLRVGFERNGKMKEIVYEIN